MDVSNPDSIVQTGFLKKYWKSAAGDWQRFGPGFYFALQSSKSHEYPLHEMKKLKSGHHTRKMLLCKVARGKVFKTQTNLDTLAGTAPAGYHSVYGAAQKGGDLNYDEIVVYEEAAVLPWAVVEYKFFKKHDDRAGGAALSGGGSVGGAAPGRRLHAVCVAGMGVLGPGIAAEFALHGVEVRVWNDPGFCYGRPASEFSKCKVLEALVVAEQAAGLNVPTDTAREGRAPVSGGAAASRIESITAQLMSDRFIAAADLVTGCDTIAELVEGVHPHTVASGAAQPLQIVIDALVDKPEVKQSFFAEICKSPSLPRNAFLTSNSLPMDFNLSAIADKLEDFRRPYMLGMRFFLPVRADGHLTVSQSFHHTKLTSRVCYRQL